MSYDQKQSLVNCQSCHFMNNHKMVLINYLEDIYSSYVSTEVRTDLLIICKQKIRATFTLFSIV